MQTTTAPAATHIQRQRDHIETVQAQTMRSLQMQPFPYSNMIFLAGLEYLEYIMPEDPAAALEISVQRVFWNWWKNHWMRREEDFLKEVAEDHRLYHRRKIHRQLHDAETLAMEVSYHGRLLSASYSRMIPDVWKAIKAKLSPTS